MEALDTQIIYDPEPHQSAFHAHKAAYRLQVGGAGSGKSIALLWEAVQYALRYAGCQILLLRKNYPELEKGLIRDLNVSVPPELYKWNDQKHTATFRNGSIIFFGHCPKGEKSLAEYLSSAFVFIGIDELGQFSFDAWDFLTQRNRINYGCQGHYKTGRMPKPTMAGCTNPMGAGWSWIKSLFVDKRPIAQQGKNPNYNADDYWFIHSTILNNSHLMQRDPGYLERLQKLSPDLRAKFLDGDLNSKSGAYFGNFELDVHVIDLEEDRDRITWQDWQPCWLGIDWGLAHYAVALWFTRALARFLDGTRRPVIVCYRELMINETDIADFAKIVFEMSSGGPVYGSAAVERKRLGRVFASHELFGRRASPRVDQTIAAELTRALVSHGLPAAERAKGSASHQERVLGATLIHQRLNSGDLLFLSTCEELVRAIPLLARDEDDAEDVAKTSGPEDDLFDALKHGTLSFLRPTERPQQEIVREEAAKIEDPLVRWNYLRTHLKPTYNGGRVHQTIKPRWELGQ